MLLLKTAEAELEDLAVSADLKDLEMLKTYSHHSLAEGEVSEASAEEDKEDQNLEQI